MENKQYKRIINYFVQYSSIFALTPWRNSIQSFYDEGYKVNLYQFADKRIHQFKTDLEDRYNLIEIPYPKLVKYMIYIVKFFFRSLKHLGLKELSTVGDGIDILFRSYYFYISCILKNKCGENEVFIGGDPAGLITANYLAKKKNGALIYWSLELNITEDLDNFGLRFMKQKERKCNQIALCTVDFGEIRCKILQEENQLDPKTMIPIPNSQMGQGEILRNYYFNDKFNIPRDKKIILHAGGLYSPSMGVKDIFQYFTDWPDDYILVIHTYQRDYPMSGFAIPQEYFNKKIFLSEDPVPFDQLETIYSSCDIGIIVQGPQGPDINKNLYYSDLSIGKLFHYLKVGIPIIIRRLPGYVDLIEGNQVGVCIDLPSEILPAIDIILNNYHQYRLNAVNLHDKLKFEIHHKKLIGKINAL